MELFDYFYRFSVEALITWPQSIEGNTIKGKFNLTFSSYLYFCSILEIVPVDSFGIIVAIYTIISALLVIDNLVLIYQR